MRSVQIIEYIVQQSVILLLFKINMRFFSMSGNVAWYCAEVWKKLIFNKNIVRASLVLKLNLFCDFCKPVLIYIFCFFFFFAIYFPNEISSSDKGYLISLQLHHRWDFHVLLYSICIVHDMTSKTAARVCYVKLLHALRKRVKVGNFES